MYYLGKWEQRKRYDDIWGLSDLVYPWDSKILKGSTAENSKLNLLLRATAKGGGTYPVSYLRLWQKYPQVENLIVQGASMLLTRLISKDWEGSRGVQPKAIDWKQKSPSKMLGMNKDEFRACVGKKWNELDLEFLHHRRTSYNTIRPIS